MSILEHIKEMNKIDLTKVDYNVDIGCYALTIDNHTSVFFCETDNKTGEYGFPKIPYLQAIIMCYEILGIDIVADYTHMENLIKIALGENKGVQWDEYLDEVSSDEKDVSVYAIKYNDFTNEYESEDVVGHTPSEIINSLNADIKATTDRRNNEHKIERLKTEIAHLSTEERKSLMFKLLTNKE